MTLLRAEKSPDSFELLAVHAAKRIFGIFKVSIFEWNSKSV